MKRFFWAPLFAAEISYFSPTARIGTRARPSAHEIVTPHVQNAAGAPPNGEII